MSAEHALAQIEAWLGAPAAVVAHPSSRHARVLAGLVRAAGTGGNLTTSGAGPEPGIQPELTPHRALARPSLP